MARMLRVFVKSMASVAALPCFLAGSASAQSQPASTPGYVGVVFAYRTEDISAELGGVIRRYRVRLGDSLVAGQIIASLDKSTSEQDLAVAEAALRAARAEQAKATVQLDQARQVLERRRQVAWALSKEELESLAAQESLAIASVEVAKSHALEEAARVQQARGDLAKCDVKAPFAGRVGRLYHSEGALVSRGTPIARLVASSELWIRFAVPPEEVEWALPGAAALVVAEEGGPRLSARIEHVAPEVDAAAGMVFVEARLQGDATRPVSMKPGTVVRVWRDRGGAGGRARP